MGIAAVSSWPVDVATTGNKTSGATARSTAGASTQRVPVIALPGTPSTPAPEQVTQAVRQLNDAFAKKTQDLVAFVERDEETGIDVVKVVEKGTDEVIRQFPSEEIIQIAKTMDGAGEGKFSLLRVSA